MMQEENQVNAHLRDGEHDEPHGQTRRQQVAAQATGGGLRNEEREPQQAYATTMCTGVGPAVSARAPLRSRHRSRLRMLTTSARSWQ